MSVSDLYVQSAFSSINPAGMKYKGDWILAGVYQKGDVVIAPDNSTYVCIAPSGSTGVNPSTAPLAWTEIGGNASGSVQSLNGQAGTINITGTNITVGSTGAGNISLTNDAVLSVYGGSGISISGAAQTPQVNNSGILSVTAGTGVSVTPGQNPTIANTGVLSVTGSGNVSVTGGQNPSISLTSNQTDLVVGALPTASATGPNATTFITIPFYTSTDIPVVAGGVYCFQGVFSLLTTNIANYAVDFGIENGAIDTYIIKAPNTDYSAGSGISQKNIPFCCMVIPTTTTLKMFISNGNTANGGDNSQITISDMFLTRII